MTITIIVGQDACHGLSQKCPNGHNEKKTKPEEEKEQENRIFNYFIH